MVKSIYITGGSGFVGTHLHNFLNDCFGVASINNIDLRSDNTISNVLCDIRHPITVDSFPLPVDCIINLAAVHKSPGHPSHEYFETNILGARSVCDFAEKVGCKKIVFTSSIAVYGPGEDEKTEESLPMPNIPYGISKVIAEHIHREWQMRGEGRSLSIIRPAVIFGKGEGGNFTRIANALRKGIFVYPGRKDTIKSCVYVKDVCRLIMREMESCEPLSTYNCCYPQKITIEQICKAFNQELGYKLPKAVIPQSVLNTAGAMLKIIDTPYIRSMGLDPQRIAKLVNSTNISSKKLVDSGFEFKYDLNAALKDWANDCGGIILN